ncbi:unnamed protein product, partial [Arabidopsis halleri]
FIWTFNTQIFLVGRKKHIIIKIYDLIPIKIKYCYFHTYGFITKIKFQFYPYN